MGNFISKAWDKLTGADQAKKAAQVQQQALAQQQAEAAKADAQKAEVSAKYDELMPLIMGMLTGNIDAGANPMAAQSYSALRKILGELTGETVSPEQAKANEYQDNLIEMLTNPTPDQQRADEITDNLITTLTTPKDKSKEQQTADEWNEKYLSSLANSPDTAFNAGVSELARGAETQNENIRKAMQSRGISSSGINLAALGNTAADRARGVSQLQGQRADRQVTNNGIGAEYAQKLADNQIKLEDRDLEHMQLGAELAGNKANSAIDRYGQATNLVGQKADKSTNDIIQALNISNNWNQQNWNRIMDLLGAKTSLINNQAGAQYTQGLNNLADTYANNANAKSQMVGTVGGQLLSSNAGKQLASRVGTTALGGVQNVLGAVGGQNFATNAVGGITKILGLLGIG